MTPAPIADYVVESEGWRASFFYTHAYLSISPEIDLGQVIGDLFLPHHQPHWTMEWSHTDDDGWDVFLLEREPFIRSV